MWRVIAFGAALLAFAVAAVRPDGVHLFGAGGDGLRVEGMVFFWVGVAMTLAAAWARGS